MNGARGMNGNFFPYRIYFSPPGHGQASQNVRHGLRAVSLFDTPVGLPLRSLALLCIVVPLNGVGKLLAMSYYFRLEQVCPIYIPVGNLRMGSSAGSGGISNNSRSGPRSLEKRKRRLASVKCVALTRYEMRSGSEILVVCTVGVLTKEIALCEG